MTILVWLDMSSKLCFLLGKHRKIWAVTLGQNYCLVIFADDVNTVVDDFSYDMPGQRQKKLVNIVDGFQAQCGDKSCATLQTMMETAHSLLFPCAGD